MINPLQDWKDSFEILPKTNTVAWAAIFAGWYASQIISIEPDPTLLNVSASDPPFTFLFNAPVFAAGLIGLPQTPITLTGITSIANAWAAAILATPVVVGTGAFIPPTSNTTLFSAVATTIIDPASVVLGQAKILQLALSSLVGDAQDSDFPVKFREATLQLKINVAGSDSTAPTPIALAALAVPLV